MIPNRPDYQQPRSKADFLPHGYGVLLLPRPTRRESFVSETTLHHHYRETSYGPEDATIGELVIGGNKSKDDFPDRQLYAALGRNLGLHGINTHIITLGGGLLRSNDIEGTLTNVEEMTQLAVNRMTQMHNKGQRVVVNATSLGGIIALNAIARVDFDVDLMLNVSGINVPESILQWPDKFANNFKPKVLQAIRQGQQDGDHVDAQEELKKRWETLNLLLLLPKLSNVKNVEIRYGEKDPVFQATFAEQLGQGLADLGANVTMIRDYYGHIRTGLRSVLDGKSILNFTREPSRRITT